MGKFWFVRSLGALGAIVCAASSAAADTLAAERFFDERIAPILSKHCLECHDTTIREGKLDLSQKHAAMGELKRGFVIVPGDAEKSLLWQEVQNDDMPEDRPPLSKEEKEDLKKWINDGAVWSADEVDPMAHTRDPKAASNWVQRLTNREYVRTIRTATGVDIEKEAEKLLPKELRADGFSNTAYNLTIDMSHIVAYGQLAERVVGELDVMAFARKHGGEVSEERLPAVVEGMGKWLLRRPLKPDEKASFLKVAQAVKDEQGDLKEMVSYALEAMLQSPGFLYRIEAGGGDSQSAGPYELASRVSYAVWGSSPDEELMKAADRGEILQPEVLRRQVERMLDDPRAIDRSLEFADQWLNLGRLANLKPDPVHFPLWTGGLAAEMREETLEFFREVVWQRKRPLNELLNANLTVASPRLAAHYHLPRHPQLKDRKGLVALYEFDEGSGNVVHDRSGHGEPMNLKISDESKVEWADGRLRLKDKTLIRSEKPFTRGVKSLKNSKELTLEVWVENEDLNQDGPARLVSLSSGPSERNITLGQIKGLYEVRVRTPQIGGNGLPGLETPDRIVTPRLNHLVYTRDREGKGKFYLDGELINTTSTAGNFDNWNEGFHLMLGNESDGSRPWRGTFHRVAIYDRVLPAEEVYENAGGRRLYDLAGVRERGGLLTQASLLTIGGDEASMVTRGLFVLHDLLHSAVGSAPPGVDTTPQPTKAGMSQRVMAERRIDDKSCSGCHSKFEPLAFGLERYDGVGAYSEKDRHGNALREDGALRLPGVPEALPFDRAEQLMDMLAGSERVNRNFTRKMLQFTLGRPLLGSDSRAIAAIHEKSQEGGGTYRSLMTAIATSEILRTIPNPQTP
jgi:hypothetical protein